MNTLFYFEDEYCEEDMETMIHTFRCSNNLDFVRKNGNCRGTVLYCLVKYVELDKYHYDFIESVLKDPEFDFQDATKEDIEWLKRLLIFQLTDQGNYKIAKMLVKYHVFDDILLDDYDDVVPTYHEPESQEHMSLSELFVHNTQNGNMFRINLQIKYSNLNKLRTISNYLDEDMDCDMTILNYTAYYCERNKFHIVKLLLKNGFSDGYTSNSRRRKVRRPLCCLESACFGGDLELMKIIAKAKNDDYFENLEYSLKYSIMCGHNIRGNSLECIRVALNADFTEAEEKILYDIINGVKCSTLEVDKILEEFTSRVNIKTLRLALRNTDLPSIDKVPRVPRAVTHVFGTSDLVEHCINEFL
jgi:hypothetical protein